MVQRGPGPGSPPDGLHNGYHALHIPDVLPVPFRACVHPLFVGVILHPQRGEMAHRAPEGVPIWGPEGSILGS